MAVSAPLAPISRHTARAAARDVGRGLRRVDSVRIELIGGRVVATACGVAYRLPREARISTAHAAELAAAGVRVELCL